MSQAGGAVTLEQARAAKQRVGELLGSARTYVVGLGLTRVGAGYGVKVNLRAAVPPNIPLPSNIDNVPLVFEVVGTIAKR